MAESVEEIQNQWGNLIDALGIDADSAVKKITFLCEESEPLLFVLAFELDIDVSQSRGKSELIAEILKLEEMDPVSLEDMLYGVKQDEKWREDQLQRGSKSETQFGRQGDRGRRGCKTYDALIDPSVLNPEIERPMRGKTGLGRIKEPELYRRLSSLINHWGIELNLALAKIEILEKLSERRLDILAYDMEIETQPSWNKLDIIIGILKEGEWEVADLMNQLDLIDEFCKAETEEEIARQCNWLREKDRSRVQAPVFFGKESDPTGIGNESFPAERKREEGSTEVAKSPISEDAGLRKEGNGSVRVSEGERMDSDAEPEQPSELGAEFITEKGSLSQDGNPEYDVKLDNGTQGKDRLNFPTSIESMEENVRAFRLETKERGGASKPTASNEMFSNPEIGEHSLLVVPNYCAEGDTETVFGSPNKLREAPTACDGTGNLFERGRETQEPFRERVLGNGIWEGVSSDPRPGFSQEGQINLCPAGTKVRDFGSDPAEISQDLTDVQRERNAQVARSEGAKNESGQEKAIEGAFCAGASDFVRDREEQNPETQEGYKRETELVRFLTETRQPSTHWMDPVIATKEGPKVADQVVKRGCGSVREISSKIKFKTPYSRKEAEIGNWDPPEAGEKETQGTDCDPPKGKNKVVVFRARKKRKREYQLIPSFGGAELSVKTIRARPA